MLNIILKALSKSCEPEALNKSCEQKLWATVRRFELKNNDQQHCYQQQQSCEQQLRRKGFTGFVYKFFSLVYLTAFVNKFSEICCEQQGIFVNKSFEQQWATVVLNNSCQE